MNSAIAKFVVGAGLAENQGIKSITEQSKPALALVEGRFFTKFIGEIQMGQGGFCTTFIGEI